MPPPAAPKPAASSSAAAPKAASKPAPKPAAGPVGQQWIAAAKAGNRQEMEELLAANGQELVTYKARGIGHTALHWAAASGERGIMEWLLSLGADVNARNTSESTVLHAACGAGQAYSVEWLLARGADATLKNDDGLTAAQIATNKGRKDLAKKITDHIEAPVPQAPPKPAEAAASGGGQPTPADEVSAARVARGAAMWEGHTEEVD